MIIILGFLLLITVKVTAGGPLVPWVVFVVAFFVGLQVFFPIRLLFNRIDLMQVTTLSAGVLYGAASAGWGGALGFFSGYALQGLREPSPYYERAEKKPLPNARRLAAIQEIGFSIGAHTLALQLTLVLSGFVNGWVGIGEVESLAMAVLRLSLPLVMFAIFHGVLYLVDFALRPERAGWR
ncbi:MAG TPA: hypothetical protein VLS48_06745, partial [Anaerolineales bacterium]|nr:hypothetical protein [Anaerolineales bacterium]